jgi:UDP-N-acetylglucosamine transferase subunit ALG13
MIFLALGTQLPFDRLTRAMDDWCAADPARTAFGQIAELGPENHRPTHFEWVERMPPDAFVEKFAAADAVVAHAGMGVIITALTMGKPLIIMPRRADLREHRNDHQIATAARFGTKPGVTVVVDAGGLHAALDHLAGGGAAAAGDAAPPLADPHFTDALRSFILSGALPPRRG